MYRRYLQPIGFDIENTYRLGFLIDEQKMDEIIKQTGKERKDIIADCGWVIFDRVNRCPEVEKVAVSYMIYPYFSGEMSINFTINGDTTKQQGASCGFISPEYFDVFKIPVEKGRAFTWEDYAARQIIINQNDRSTI